MPASNQQADDLDDWLRVLHTLEIIGRAHLYGGLHVAETLPLTQQCEVGAALDHLAQFASLIDTNRPKRHERPE